MHAINQTCFTKVYAELKIPKIQLNAPIYFKDSPDNMLNKGLFLLKESIYLEEENAKLLIASHSGTSPISYFKNLDEVELQDEIIIERGNKRYFYRVIDKYYEKKDGNIKIKEYKEKYIALITCTKDSQNLQTVVIALLTGEMNNV